MFVVGTLAPFGRHPETGVPFEDAVFEFLVSLHAENAQPCVLEGFGQTEHNHANGLFGGRGKEGKWELPKSDNMENEAYNQQIDAGLG